ncbi:NAD(P)-dependent oxidoreductase [Marinobacter xestospongiae]|uniref:NAD(P)-dependent oxidoreductase n=1 Tax=Marinobacter xestospongiae TaxID=994319 RepID=UPI002005B2A8|nr:NAD(P)H-binding protein [Marinobacter xestospongiae]MCK7565115.1 NAD(P)H-binding protein [Marinobacter xestospongiae]
MKITVLGAAGNVGRRVVAEALARGHEVSAVVRDARTFEALPEAAIAKAGDATDPFDVARLTAGQDVVVNATRPPAGDRERVFEFTRSLMSGVARSKVRLIVVGGAATLTVPGTGGRTVMEDASYLPVSARHIGRASADQQEACQAESTVDWVYLSPPANLVAGERTGQYRLGTDELVVDSDGNSSISIEDLAVALIDEAEAPRHHQQRFTVAY